MKPDTDLPGEVDFSEGKLGHFAGRLNRATIAVVLEPGLTEFFPDSEAVNQALHAVLEARKKAA